MVKDLYKILQIDKDSSVEDINTAYRKLAMENHPDQNNGKLGDLWNDIQEAYNILKDSLKRKIYDDTGYICNERDIDRKVIAFIRQYLVTLPRRGEQIFEMNLIEDLSNICNQNIINIETRIVESKQQLKIFNKLKKKFKKKKNQDNNIVQMILIEEMISVNEFIRLLLIDIEMFKIIKNSVNEYEFDLTKYIEGVS